MLLKDIVNVLDNTGFNRDVRYLKITSEPQNIMSWVNPAGSNVNVRVNGVVYNNVSRFCLVTRDVGVLLYLEYLVDGFVRRFHIAVDDVRGLSIL